MIEIILILLVLMGYIFFSALTYALCIFLDIGVDHDIYSGDDRTPSIFFAIFWPVGIWIVITIGLGRKMGNAAKELRENLERKKKNKKNKMN